MVYMTPQNLYTLPEFYKIKPDAETHPRTNGLIMAVTDEHRDADWLTLGYVSRRSPFGHGTYLGFPKTEVEPAEAAEVLAAIEQPHPICRWWFKPSSRAARDVGIYEAISSGIVNWGEVFAPPPLEAARVEADILRKWGGVARKQIRVLKQHFDQAAVQFGSFFQ